MNDQKKGIDFIGVTCVFFCHDGNGNILLSKRSNNCRDEKGRWEPGGGSLELHESIEKVIQREIVEEYGTNAMEISFLGHRESFRTNDEEVKTHWIAFDHMVLVDRKNVFIGEPDKCDELIWTTLEDLPEPLHSAMPDFLERYDQQIRSILE